MAGETAASERTQALAQRLRTATDALVDVIRAIGPDRWNGVPGTGTWSIGKDVEHVAEAAAMHQWIVQRTIGDRVPSRRPAIERKVLTTTLSAADAVALLLQRTDEGCQLLLRLSDEQLDLPTRPPRAGGQRLGETIERVLIGHIETHRADIEAKLQPGE